MAQVLEMAAMTRIMGRKVARFGSYGWSGGAQKHMSRIIEPLRWDLIDVFEFTGRPTEDELRRGEQFGARFARVVKERQITPQCCSLPGGCVSHSSLRRLSGASRQPLRSCRKRAAATASTMR